MRKYVSLVGLILVLTLLAGCFGGGSSGTGGTQTGNIKGQIFDSETDELITDSEVYVTLNGNPITITDGKYSFTNIAIGPKNLKAVAVGYKQESVTVEIAAGTTVTKDLYLNKDPGDLGGLLENIKDAGVAFTGFWESDLQNHAEDQIAPFAAEVGEQLMLALGPIFDEDFEGEMEIDYDEDAGTVTVTHNIDGRQTVTYKIFVNELFLDPEFFALQLETLLDASFTLTNNGEIVAQGNLGLLADIDWDVFELWITPGQDGIPELFFSVMELTLDAFFEVEDGKMEINGNVKLDLEENTLNLLGEVETPVLAFLGTIDVVFAENEAKVFDELLPVYPSQADLYGELHLPDLAKFEGNLNFAFEPNAVLAEDMTIILPKTAHFSGSYTEFTGNQLTSIGEFNFTWHDIDQFREIHDLNLEASFQGSVQTVNGFPITLVINTWVTGLEGETDVTYQFGNRTLSGGGWIGVTLDEYDDLESIAITAILEDNFGYELELAIYPDTEGEIATIRDPEGEFVATILIRDGLPFVKYQDGTMEELF